MAKSKNELDISVLIPTYNRAKGLRETLEAMCRVERDGLAVEFVVIDNNSTDHTKEVVESFIGQLPIRYLFEPRSGKSCALNKALDEVTLGEIVVFTDDDVTPKEDWLQAILAATQRWPDHAVFGGKVQSIWPHGSPPAWWRQDPSGPGFGLSGQDLGDSDRLYPTRVAGIAPCGANMWVRRALFANGWRFDESVGPHPTNRIMGSDTSFTLWVSAHGYGMVWSPDAVIKHRIQETLTTASGIKKRAWYNGRGGARVAGLCRSELFEKSPAIWKLMRVGSLMWATVRYLRAMTSLSHDGRLGKSLEPISDIAYNLECLRMSGRLRRHVMGVNKS